MTNIGAALGWKYPGVEGICTRQGVITKWPDALGAVPTAEQQRVIISEYEDAAAWERVRAKRNQLLVDSDFTQCASSEVDELSKNKAAWVDYRKQLRNITLQPDPNDITWPAPPS